MKKNVIATQTKSIVFPNDAKRTATSCGKPLNRVGGVNVIAGLTRNPLSSKEIAEQVRNDGHRICHYNERSARSLDFWFFLSRTDLKQINQCVAFRREAKRTEKFLIN